MTAIIIFFNAEKFIQEAIESVLAQTYESWELLLVDDGSTDASTGIALRYAAQYPEKVRYLEHPGHQNRGMSAARNLGIRSARGECIAFLDADDVWLPHALERQVSLLDSHPQAGMLYGPIQFWHSWEENPQKPDWIQELGVPLDSYVEPEELLTILVREDRIESVPCTGSFMLRREVAQAVGGYEEEFRAMYEDLIFHVKVCLAAPVFATRDSWLKYRRHPGSNCLTETQTGQARASRLNYLIHFEKLLSAGSLQNTPAWKFLQDELWPIRHPLVNWCIKFRARLRRQLRRALGNARLRPPLGWVRLGSLRRVRPISSVFGFDRGLPIDRYYIEQFVARHAEDIRGHVLEVGSPIYTRKFGADRVTRSDVIHVVPGNPKATIVADLTCADHIPSNTFDCIILTQTLQVIYDQHAALRHVHRILKPGGVLLVTSHGIGRMDLADDYRDQWHLKSYSARRLFAEFFPEGSITVQAYGNVLAATACLYGLASQELRPEELNHFDPSFETIVGVRAVKPPDRIPDRTEELARQ